MPELVKDPVCGMDIETQRAVASAMAEDRRFYFCCLRCQAAFGHPASLRWVAGRSDPPARGGGRDRAEARARAVPFRHVTM
jgi:YHS domain-containing protein